MSVSVLKAEAVCISLSLSLHNHPLFLSVTTFTQNGFLRTSSLFSRFYRLLSSLHGHSPVPEDKIRKHLPKPSIFPRPIFFHKSVSNIHKYLHFSPPPINKFASGSLIEIFHLITTIIWKPMKQEIHSVIKSSYDLEFCSHSPPTRGPREADVSKFQLVHNMEGKLSADKRTTMSISWMARSEEILLSSNLDWEPAFRTRKIQGCEFKYVIPPTTTSFPVQYST